MWENIKLSFRGIRSHMMRSVLTMLGIVIGIASIIAIVSTIRGTNEQIQNNLIGSGENNVSIMLYQGDYEYTFDQGIPSGVTVLDESTKEALANLDGVQDVSYYVSRQDYDAAFYQSNALNGGKIYGVEENYLSCAGYTMQQGRDFIADDFKKYRNVAVLDQDSAQALFQGVNPIGKTIEVKGTPFVIIGVAVEKHPFEPVINSVEDYYTYQQDRTGSIYVPMTSWPVIYQYDEPESVLLKAENTNAMTKAGKEAADILNQTLVNYGSDENSFKYKAQDLLEQARQIQQLSQSTNTMLLWIAAISLLVGGIGVMNIMLVSVTERTSEIGLKKAIGARKKAIMAQFLTEAVVLTSLGGVIGVLVGIALAEVISKLNQTPVAIDPVASLFAVLFSMVIGIVFGIIPSHKAANLNPIDALRHE